MTLTATPVFKRMGITEDKKAELDALQLKVLDAQQDVEQYQAIVSALTDKLNNFNGFLAASDSVRTSALNNYNLVKQLVQNGVDLKNNSVLAFGEMGVAGVKIQALAKQVKQVVDQLIYSAEVFNKLAITVTRAKALNPLISDDLVARISAAGTDANNAVSLALVALQSTFATQATSLQSMEAITLEKIQAVAFHQALTEGGSCILDLLKKAYDDAIVQYNTAQTACNIVTNQLADAQSKLGKAQVKLNSLQNGLNAANAAALAS